MSEKSAKPSSRVRFPPSPQFPNESRGSEDQGRVHQTSVVRPERSRRTSLAFGSGGAEVRRQKAEVCETDCRVCDFRVAWHAEKVMTADVDLQGEVPSVGRLTPDQPSSDPTIELSKGLKNRGTICELLRT